MADHLVVKSASVSNDALVRAWRTFYTAVGLDILILIGAGLSSLMESGVDVTSGVFWSAAGVLVLKSVFTGLATYLLRLKVTPKNETDLPPAPAVDTGYTEPELGTAGLESSYDAKAHEGRYP